MLRQFVQSVLVGLALPAAIVSARPVTLAQDGAARAAIVVAADATQAERFAAEQLRMYLKEITGADFTTAGDPVEAPVRILVGPGAARLAIANFSTDDLGPDGIAIRTFGDDLILAGGRPRGTLYAVFTFLEYELGCRWWAPDATTLPKARTIRIDPTDYRYVPPLEYREPFWTCAFDPDWAVRNKCNGNTPALDASRGGKHIYEGFVHTFYPLIPPQTYFNDHPEWFSEINGKRTHEHAQLCLTNEAMRQELVRNLKARLRANPAATIASVSQNDWAGNCQCAACAAVEKEEESPAGLVLRFVNAVATDIETEFPHVAISTLAYQYTRKPPRLTRPRPNVIVRLCSIECSFSLPLAHERNAKFRDDIIGWSKICDRLYIWDYTTNFRHYFLPHPNLRVLGPNVKFFAEHSVKGIFEQGAYTSPGAEMAELRAWVLAKLLWDPRLDGSKAIDEFLRGYYGPAAEHIKAYLDITHNAVEQSGDWLGCFSEHTAKFLSFDTLSAGWTSLQAAEGAVRDNPDLLFRVKVAQLPVLYTLMMRWDEMRTAAAQAGKPWPVSDSIQQVFEQFMDTARKKNVTRLNEWADGYGNLEQAVARAGSSK